MQLVCGALHLKGLNKSETKLELVLESRKKNVYIKDNTTLKRALHYHVKQHGFTRRVLQNYRAFVRAVRSRSVQRHVDATDFR